MLGITRFKKDPFSIVKTTIIRTAVYSVLLAVCVLLKSPDWQSIALYIVPMILVTMNGSKQMFIGLALMTALVTYQFGLSLLDLGYVVAAILVTFPVSALAHGSAHMSLRPRFLNRWVGEVMGAFHNVSPDIWSVVHYYHHRYTDQPGLDPHPCEGLGFRAFLKANGKSFAQAFTFHFFESHPRSERTLKAFKLIALNFIIRNPLVTLIWFILLGPRAFVFFYAVNIVFKKYHYAWFNWATHLKHGDTVNTANLNHGLYRLVNPISFNLYYHQNHHRYPNALNPKNVPAAALADKEKDNVAA